MRSSRILGIVAVIGLFAVGHVARAGVLTTPTLVGTEVSHTYRADGKTTISTHIEDTVQFPAEPTWTPTWVAPTTWVSTLSAPDGYHFVVTPASGFGGPTSMVLTTGWDVLLPRSDYTTFFSTTSYAFGGLTGVAPPLSGSSSNVGQALYSLGAQANFLVSEPFSFTSITFTTTPPYDLTVFPTQVYYPLPGIRASITGEGSLPNSSLISLQPIPEPASLLMLAIGGLTSLMLRRGQRFLGD